MESVHAWRVFTHEPNAGVEKERVFKEGYHVSPSRREPGLHRGKNQLRPERLTADFVLIQGFFMLTLYAKCV